MDRRALLRAALVAGAAACGPVRRASGPVARPEPSAAATSPAPAATSPAPSPSPSPVVETLLCRQAWGARPPADGMRVHTIRQLTVHHAAVPLPNLTDGPAHLREYQSFHMDAHGWHDIAYHVAVDRAGHVYELRRPDLVGDTNTAYDPAGHFLLLLDGHFDTQQPSSEQLETAARVLAWAAATFGVGLDTVSGHRDHAVTSCPGDHLYTRLGELTARAEALRAAGGVELVEVCGDQGRAAVAAIESGRA